MKAGDEECDSASLTTIRPTANTETPIDYERKWKSASANKFKL